MSLTYTDPAKVSDLTTTAQPSNPYASGYGPKIPTRHMFRYEGRMRRVYVACYGNSGSAYIVVNGASMYLDTDTEHRLAA